MNTLTLTRRACGFALADQYIHLVIKCTSVNRTRWHIISQTIIVSEVMFCWFIVK